MSKPNEPTPPCVILRIARLPGGRNVFLYVHVTVSFGPSSTEVSPVSRSGVALLVLFADPQTMSVSEVYAGTCSRNFQVAPAARMNDCWAGLVLEAVRKNSPPGERTRRP